MRVSPKHYVRKSAMLNPYHLIVSLRSPNNNTSSAPTSPYPGLDKQQIKKFHAAFAKTDAKVDNLWELLSMSGVEMAKQEVVDLITKWADLKLEV
jgi:hypothetical protein